eukprot:1421529-Amphidinium_carterae.1
MADVIMALLPSYLHMMGSAIATPAAVIRRVCAVESSPISMESQFTLEPETPTLVSKIGQIFKSGPRMSRP